MAENNQTQLWKVGFTEGSWDDFIIYLKQMTGK